MITRMPRSTNLDASSRPLIRGISMSASTTSGSQAVGQTQRLRTVPRPCEHLDVLLELEQRAQRPQHHRLVFGDDDPDHATSFPDA